MERERAAAEVGAMRRKAFLTMVALSLLASGATGAWAADAAPFGYFGGVARGGTARHGVTQQQPGLPDSAAPGFGYELDTTHFLNGMHSVTARVTSRTGQVVYLNSFRLQF